MPKKFALLVALVVAVPAAAEIKIEGERVVPVHSFAELTVPGKPAVMWKVYPAPAKKVIRGGALLFSGPPGAVYTVWATVIDFDAKTVEEAEAVVTVGGPAPVPPGPTPPDPKPPTPTPDPPPFPAVGLHVLIVYETSAVYPPAQVSAMYSKSVREYLDAKCAMGPDGKTKAWRIWDKDVDLENDRAVWKLAMAKTGVSLPWILISDGTKGHSGPLPANADDLLKLLKRFGGE